MKVVIRADATRDIGTGHIMRCLSLAQGLKDFRGDVAFVTCCQSKKILERVEKEGFRVHVLRKPESREDTLSVLEAENPQWTVLDGYHFDGEYQRAVWDTGSRVLVIDDFAHLNRYTADIILNQNFGAESFSYHAEPHTRMLMGTDYVLLRREFLQYRGFARHVPETARKLLITMGGADEKNNARIVLTAANMIEASLEMRVILGASNVHGASIEKESVVSHHDVEILHGVEDMASLLAWADMAVSAGGTTLWELAFMGLPSLLCIVAENQENAVRSLASRGYPNVGWVEESGTPKVLEELEKLLYNKKLREELVEVGRKMVDGRGVQRVMKQMEMAV